MSDRRDTPEDSERLELREYRRGKFKVEVTKQRSPNFSGELSLSITHNGYQWQSIGLMPDEAEKAIAALQQALGTPSETESRDAEDAERYRWFRDECAHDRRYDILDAADGVPDMIDHHIDKGRCGL